MNNNLQQISFHIGVNLTIPSGAICISKVFMGKCLLQVLDMLGNNIGDGGITAIAGALSTTQIDELDLSDCGITLTGAALLAERLLVNNSVKSLYVDNQITVEGARLILQSAVSNGICQMVDIGRNYNDDDEVKKMNIILEQRMKVRLKPQREKQKVGGCVV